MIASIGGADAVLIVAEPTVSGRHDMERVAQLAAHFRVPAIICVNKFDLNPEMAGHIESFAKKKDIVCLGHIPFDPVFTKAMLQAQTVLEYDNRSKASRQIKEIWQHLSENL